MRGGKRTGDGRKKKPDHLRREVIARVPKLELQALQGLMILFLFVIPAE
jgi:hypothetical protein